MTAAAVTIAVLVGLSVGMAVFLAGVLYEHCRDGGTADLEDRLRIITRLRPIREEVDPW